MFLSYKLMTFLSTKESWWIEDPCWNQGNCNNYCSQENILKMANTKFNWILSSANACCATSSVLQAHQVPSTPSTVLGSQFFPIFVVVLKKDAKINQKRPGLCPVKKNLLYIGIKYSDWKVQILVTSFH